MSVLRCRRRGSDLRSPLERGEAKAEVAREATTSKRERMLATFFGREVEMVVLVLECFSSVYAGEVYCLLTGVGV